MPFGINSRGITMKKLLVIAFMLSASTAFADQSDSTKFCYSGNGQAISQGGTSPSQSGMVCVYNKAQKMMQWYPVQRLDAFTDYTI